MEEFDTKDSLYLVMEYVKVRVEEFVPQDKKKGSFGVLFIGGNYDGNINQVTMEKWFFKKICFILFNVFPINITL